MPSATRTRSARPTLAAVSLFLFAGLTAPAFAQIETVVVTAEKKAEDIQTVPIAVSAYSGQDLKARQVVQFKDLQFHVPNVTYTNTNFGGANFQIAAVSQDGCGDQEPDVEIEDDDDDIEDGAHDAGGSLVGYPARYRFIPPQTREVPGKMALNSAVSGFLHRS